MAKANTPAEDSYVLLGTVTRPHGIKGEVKVQPFTAEPENFARYRRLYLSESEHGAKIEYGNRQARVSGHQVILCLQECNNRDMAESLAGQLVWLATKDLPPLEADEFYLHTLIGKNVRTVEGQELGRAENFLDGGGQDILVVRQGKEEHLIPIVRSFVDTIGADVVVLDLPEGLLEING